MAINLHFNSIYTKHGTLMSRMTYILDAVNQILYLMVWLNAMAISVIMIILELIRRQLLYQPFKMPLLSEMKTIV